MATVIRVCAEDGGCHDYNLADFGGQLPVCGDAIIAPLSAVRAAEGPQVWEVVSRLFDPGRAFDAGGSLRLMVRTRPATQAELAAFAQG